MSDSDEEEGMLDFLNWCAGDRGDGNSRGGGGSNASHAAPKMLGGLMPITGVNDVYNVYKMDVISDALVQVLR